MQEERVEVELACVPDPISACAVEAAIPQACSRDWCASARLEICWCLPQVSVGAEPLQPEFGKLEGLRDIRVSVVSLVREIAKQRHRVTGVVIFGVSRYLYPQLIPTEAGKVPIARWREEIIVVAASSIAEEKISFLRDGLIQLELAKL